MENSTLELTVEQKQAVDRLADLCLGANKVTAKEIETAVRQAMVKKALTKTYGHQRKASAMVGLDRGTVSKVVRDLGYKKQGNY